MKEIDKEYQAKNTVLDTVRIYNITGIDITEVGQWERLRPILEAQAEISFKAGIKYRGAKIIDKELLLTDEEIDRAWEDDKLSDDIFVDMNLHCKLVAQAQLDKVLNHPAVATGLKLWGMIPEGKKCDFGSNIFLRCPAEHREKGGRIMDKERAEQILKQLGVEHTDCLTDPDCPACAALKVIEYYEPLIAQAREEGIKEGRRQGIRMSYEEMEREHYIVGYNLDNVITHLEKQELEEDK